MKKHPPEEFITLLREAGASSEMAADFCRRQGISEQTLYRWGQKYGSLGQDKAERLKGLEVENAKLKKLLAEALLANEAMKEPQAHLPWRVVPGEKW
jgi:putative transposase